VQVAVRAGGQQEHDAQRRRRGARVQVAFRQVVEARGALSTRSTVAWRTPGAD
jgi:hypothetical protein